MGRGPERGLTRAMGPVMLLLLLACTSRPVPPPDAPDVVVVLVDALRADRLGPWGGPTTPTVDRLAAEGVVFDRAITPDAWTVPAVASLLTGLHPQAHRVLRLHEDGLGMDALADDLTTVVEVFRDSGWRTGVLTKSPVVSRRHGHAQGADTFRETWGDQASQRSAAELTEAAVAWLADPPRGRPRFLYLHYMDPHSPYQAPDPDLDPDLVATSALDGSHGPIAALSRGEAVATEADVALLRARYDAEVAYVDAQLAPLLAALDPERTVVVLIADHGEQLGDHGGWLHQHLWQENTHVPLIVRAPGLEHRRVTPRVSTVDLAPTLAELAGLRLPVGWEGRTLLNARPGRVFSEYGADQAVWEGDLKLLVDADGARLYDVATDPSEAHDLADERPSEVLRLRRVLEAHRRETRAAGRELLGAGPRPMTDAQARALHALGYLD